MMVHKYTSKELQCFFRPILYSYGQWFSQQVVDTLDAVPLRARPELFFSVCSEYLHIVL